MCVHVVLSWAGRQEGREKKGGNEEGRVGCLPPLFFLTFMVAHGGVEEGGESSIV